MSQHVTTKSWVLAFGLWVFKWSSKGSIFRCQSTWFYKILYLVCPCAISSVLSGSHGEAEPAGACVAHRFDTSREEKRFLPERGFAKGRMGIYSFWGPRIFYLTPFCEMGKLDGCLPFAWVACFFSLCTATCFFPTVVESQTKRNTSHCPLCLQIAR